MQWPLGPCYGQCPVLDLLGKPVYKKELKLTVKLELGVITMGMENQIKNILP